MEKSDLYADISSATLPIVYSDKYNIHFMGLEKLHPFDASKWGNIFKLLKTANFVNENTISRPKEATKNDLRLVHTKKYLKSLNYSFRVALIAEILPMALLPNYCINKAFLKPMRYQTGGSILAGKLAIERGWSINLGGGFHHCTAIKGGGFCVYADITLLIQFALKNYPLHVQNVMIVDLDAHQGNGHERDFKNNQNVYILDVYNRGIYPKDEEAKKYINRMVELDFGCSDEGYLRVLNENLDGALDEFQPQLVVYNAGTDVMKGDPLGGLAISAKGVIERDEMVFTKVRAKNIPIVMLTSGGYLKKSANVISSSILNMYNVGLINK